ncbi:hypothetical protein Q4595_05790 [Wenyingzhuangia sp. 1_MG-2023]|nr:hypothetical protein [Wenyingzhuangia sp. 1_MG-2023]
MHNFFELINLGIKNNLDYLNNVESEVLKELEYSAATILIKNLQSINLQKAIIITGAFSIFESRLQDSLNCNNGFKEVRTLLKAKNKTELKYKFELFYMAINVIKHGKGKSYDRLALEKELPFKLIHQSHQSFEEGNISEIHTLIKVDDKFIYDCLDLINKIITLFQSEKYILI